MDYREFERICRLSRVEPVKKIEDRDASIYIADGYWNTHPEMPFPHWRTVWMVARTENDAAQPLYFRFGESTQKQRVAAAEQMARVWVKDNVEARRYA